MAFPWYSSWVASSKREGVDAPLPTMAGFRWTARTVKSSMRRLEGDLWCVRDALCALLQWAPGSEEWRRFIEAPDGPADMERLIDHLGLVAYDPDYPEHAALLREALDHPGVASYKFHLEQMEHCQYQPHLRHFMPLGPEYGRVDPNPELFQIIVDLRQAPHPECLQCQRHV